MFEYIDNNLKHLFQKDVTLTLGSKQYKKGKFINYKFNGCYISFNILSTKKKEIFEIPFPYSVRSISPNCIVFDYTFEALAQHDFELSINLKSVSPVKKCKFYNTTLSISY